MSKDVKPKVRIGRKPLSRPKKIALWTVLLLAAGGAGYAAYYYTSREVVEVPLARARQGDFIRSVRARGEVRSTRSIVLSAPQVPGLRIVKLAQNGQAVRKGDVVVEFDSASQEEALTRMNLQVRTVESQKVQTLASHKMTNQSDQMSLMQSEYALERAKLEASKAEIVSKIEKAKADIQVGLSEGSLDLTRANINLHQVSQQTELQRLETNFEKVNRDLERVKNYLSRMTLTAPVDGVVNILSNFRSGGDFGRAGVPFREGDSVPTGMAIAEIPDLSEMRVQADLEEVDRGRVKLGQTVKVRVDAIPDKEFEAVVNWISPIAVLQFRGGGRGLAEKQFPLYATLKNLDPRLRPGMSASLEIIIESQPSVMLIPLRASFTANGKPAVYVQKGDQFELRQVEVGPQNEREIVVLSGLREGEMVALENPREAAQRAKKKRL